MSLIAFVFARNADTSDIDASRWSCSAARIFMVSRHRTRSHLLAASLSAALPVRAAHSLRIILGLDSPEAGKASSASFASAVETPEDDRFDLNSIGDWLPIRVPENTER